MYMLYFIYIVRWLIKSKKKCYIRIYIYDICKNHICNNMIKLILIFYFYP